MFLQGMVLGEYMGLMARRRKWHLAEYKRLLANLKKVPLPNQAIAIVGLLQHHMAIVEIDACANRKEPSWGDERSITEEYLDWGDDESPQEDDEPSPEEKVGLGLA